MQILSPSVNILTKKPSIEIYTKLEYAARTCYNSYDKMTGDSYKTFIPMILKRGHEGILEHESISVEIITSRNITHELVRHRVASYAQASTRYINLYDKVSFISPTLLSTTTDPLVAMNIMAYLNKAEELYRELIDSGIKPEFARDVLPGCLATTIIVTMNLREWRYVLKLRTSKFAHPDMQKLMKQLLYELKEYLPLIFNDIQEE